MRFCGSTIGLADTLPIFILNHFTLEWQYNHFFKLMRIHFNKLKALFTICFIIMATNIGAQTKPDYETISTAQGLSQGMIFDLLQDKEGFIWVATKNGLNRFDGYNFKVFTNDPYNSFSLSGNTILKIVEDSKGRIWVGTENEGLNIYDKKTDKFYRIAHLTSDPASLSGNGIRAMMEMPDGRMLVATSAGLNIIQLRVDIFETTARPLITRLVLPNNAPVYGMGLDATKTIWVGGMDRTVYRFEPSTSSFFKLKGAEILNSGYYTIGQNILIGNNLFLSDGHKTIPLFDVKKTPPGNIMFRPREQLWENHHRELHFYDVSKWAPGKQVHWNEQLPAETRLVYPYIIDRSGIVWSGSVGYGLRKYNTGNARFKQVDFTGTSVRWIVPVGNNDIFVGNYAYDWKRLKMGVAKENAFDIIANITRIDNFIVSKSGDYWIKSDGKGYFKYTPSSRKLVAITGIKFFYSEGDKQPMLEDSDGNIWFSGLGGKFARLHVTTNSIDSFSIDTNPDKPILSKTLCTSLFQDNEGVFWIGTQEGFAKVVFGDKERETPAIKWYFNNSNNRNSLNYNHVSSFLDDPSAPERYLWIGTKGGGLNRLDKKTGDFIHLTKKNGLPDDVVYGLLADNGGNIWGSTNKGIFCLIAPKSNDLLNGVFRNFTKDNGLQDDEFNTGAYAKLPNGNLAFGGVNGLNIFDPAEMLVNGFVPNVFITDILINNQLITPGDKSGLLKQAIEHAKSISLSYMQDILTLEFSSLDFTAPGQNRYRYQLVGIDKNWVESGTRRSATYLHLPPGNLVFKVQGSNSQGVWSNHIAQLYITVLPPWWRTWWAYGLYILLLAFGVQAYFKFTINRARLKAQLNFEHLEAKRVKELDVVKTRLYTNITHEFRTPLTVILGMAKQVKINPELHLNNGLEMIIRNGQSLLKLVNEMLDLSKLETGKMKLQLVNGDLIGFLRYVIESFHSLAESQQKQLHFLSDIDTFFISYDPEKIGQIVSNLLSNALKFTPPKGNIYININLAEGPLKNDRVSIFILKIKDTGIGIPQGQLEHIFDRFYQLDNSQTRQTEGTGIGLALTKELVKLMNGEITVKSPSPGLLTGSEFTIVLPLMYYKDIANSTLPIGKTSFASSGLINTIDPIDVGPQNQREEKPLILLVEDNADVVAYTASCLPDYRLAITKDGKEGFDAAIEIIPDLIITDVMMPFVDGFELCTKLRNNENTSHIPIIMLTAKADRESKMEGLQKGADVYLEKPFHPEELLLRINKLLELRKSVHQYYLKKAGMGNINDSAAEPVDSVLSEAEPIDDKFEDAFVKKVRGVIEENAADADFTVEQLCKLLFLSHSQLHRKLDALTGSSPNKFIRIIRLNKARYLLLNTDMSIGLVALDCGYSDPGYLARIFKQEHGITPQEWRATNKNKV